MLGFSTQCTVGTEPSGSGAGRVDCKDYKLPQANLPEIGFMCRGWGNLQELSCKMFSWWSLETWEWEGCFSLSHSFWPRPYPVSCLCIFLQVCAIFLHKALSSCFPIVAACRQLWKAPALHPNREGPMFLAPNVPGLSISVLGSKSQMGSTDAVLSVCEGFLGCWWVGQLSQAGDWEVAYVDGNSSSMGTEGLVLASWGKWNLLWSLMIRRAF